ncbi:MAG: hypothetical protein M9899_05660 [Bdellovibrionaceae bacterium]|nr:hypothetical protein [Pseudobdellovibrionaceae bacterium]
MKSLVILISTLFIGVAANAQTVTYVSPNGITEVCRALPKLPNAKYSKGDIEDETALCAIDFYNDPTVALCPKTWSTSPATMLYDISKSGLTQEKYEAQRSCGGSKAGHDKITKYKQTLNMKGTSGTYAPSSFVYYHLSRYFDTSVKVPVAVYRSMDRKAHLDRVTKKAYQKRMGKGDKIREGWKWLYDFETRPAQNLSKRADFFADERADLIYGMLGDGGGERYGEQINGIRTSWGDKQNYEFQETPAFVALKSEKPLLEAIADGLASAQKNAVIKKAMGGGASDFQMALWMKELTEIVILDHILNQQDRIGNIDFRWYYYWVDAEGKVQSQKLEDANGDNVDTLRSLMSKIVYPQEVDGAKTVLVQRTRINDNDAGVYRGYTNFTKRTKMLQNIRHIDQDTYDRLLALNEDFQNQGPIYQLLKTEFHITDQDLALMVTNTLEATEILKSTNAAGKLLFDLSSAKKLFQQLVN